MSERRRLTLQERVARAVSGVIDDSVVTVRRSAEERAARRAEAEEILAELRANGQAVPPAESRPAPPRRRGPTGSRTSG
jgi:hypothetical protein